MTKVLNLAPSPLSKTKIHVSHTSIPDSYIDPTQPPTKRSPFRQVQDVKFIKSVRVCLPTNLYHAFYTPSQETKTPELPTTSFSKVILKLNDILQDHSLRTGNVVMLAQPHPPSPSAPSMPSSNSTVINFHKGTLTIEMPYSVSQCSGLGAAFTMRQVSGGGRKHEKQSARYRVSIDLREPNMIKGKPAFDRLAWASREVEGLREGRVWLMADSECAWYKERQPRRKRKRENDETIAATRSSIDEPASTSKAEPYYLNHVQKHHPTTVELIPRITHSKAILVPDVVSESKYLAALHERTSNEPPKGSLPDILEEEIHDLTEYLDLLFLKSPRITRDGYGNVDSYLCRYTLPTSFQHNKGTGGPLTQTEETNQASNISGTEDSGMSNTAKSADLSIIEYAGLLPSDFVLQLVVDLIRRSRSESSNLLSGEAPIWAALEVRAHPIEVQGGTDGFSLLLQADTSPEQQAVVADDQDTSTQPMEIDNEEQKPTLLNSRRLKFATCFEFVDSIIQ